MNLLRNLRSKLLASHLFVILVTMVVLGFLFLSLGQEYFYDSLENSLTAQAQLIINSLIPDAVFLDPSELPASAYNTVQQVQNMPLQITNAAPLDSASLAASNLSLPENLTLEINPAVPTWIRIADNSGQILLNTDPSLSTPDAVLRPEQVLSGEQSTRVEVVDGIDWFFVIQPFLILNQPAGWIEIGQPLGDVQAVLADLRLRLLLSALIGMLLAAGAALLLAGRIAKPVRQLTTAARELSSSRFDVPLQSASQDEIGELVRSFDAMRTRLQTEQQIREQFVSNVSHELRTPLTAIKGLAETLQDGAVDDPLVRDRFLASIENETDRLIRLTQGLLTLSRADAGALQLKTQPLDLAVLLHTVCATFAVQADQAGIKLTCRQTSTPVRALADPDRIEQVLVILLDNAIKHTPGGGEILLNTALCEQRNLPDHLKFSAAETWAVVNITDSGTGIPPAALPFVFNRFYRAETARDRQSGGSGLGLSIAHTLITAHGGQIWLDSPSESPAARPGLPGTSAWFALPAL
ncbi:MAG: HAMP domain-containing protein [Anaerolineales bacterium]|nr:HAMP domain-containing protein [Anaerolineales bacterium]